MDNKSAENRDDYSTSTSNMRKQQEDDEYDVDVQLIGVNFFRNDCRFIVLQNLCNLLNVYCHQTGRSFLQVNSWEQF